MPDNQRSLAPVARSAMPPCPHLPTVRRRWSPVALAGFRGRPLDGGFYCMALCCAQSRWIEGLPAQAILMIDRALLAEPGASAGMLSVVPLPYAGLAWILRHAPASGFLGNPRRHFQHLATRMGWGGLRDRRIARAWACWAISRAVLPDLPADERQLREEGVIEPTMEAVEAGLSAHGLAGEAGAWREAMPGGC